MRPMMLAPAPGRQGHRSRRAPARTHQLIAGRWGGSHLDRFHDLAHFHHLNDDGLSALPGVQRLSTTLVMKIVQDRALPL